MKKSLLFGIFCASFALMSFTIESTTGAATESVNLELAAPAPILHKSHSAAAVDNMAKCPAVNQFGPCRVINGVNVRRGHCRRADRFFHVLRSCASS